MKSKENFWTFDDMPMHVFEDIQNTDNYSLMLKSRFGKSDKCYVKWCEVNDKITDLVGKNADFMSYLRHKIKEMLYMKQCVVDGKEDKRILAYIEKVDADEYRKKLDGGTSIDENLLVLSKDQGYKLS